MATDDATPGEPFNLEEYIKGSQRPRCADCFFFVDVAPADDKADDAPMGMGSCLAEPPGIGQRQSKHPLTGTLIVQLVPVYPPTPFDSRCRRWQRDARTPGDHLAEQLERLVDTLRATAPPGDDGA